MPADMAVAVLLGVCVLSALICCIGIIVFQDFYARLHFLSAVSTVSAFSLLAAVVIKEGWGQATIKTLLTFMILLLINAVLTHVTARAKRTREHGHWAPDPKYHAREGRQP